jgi:hypothetical protein
MPLLSDSFRILPPNVANEPRPQARASGPRSVGSIRVLAGSSAQNDIDAVKDLRAWLRPQSPDPLREE